MLYPCEVYQIKPLLDVAKINVVLTDSSMLRVGKSNGSRQVPCCFVVTPSLLAVLVATITWYKLGISIIVEIHLNCSFPQTKSSDSKPRSHV